MEKMNRPIVVKEVKSVNSIKNDIYHRNEVIKRLNNEIEDLRALNNEDKALIDKLNQNKEFIVHLESDDEEFIYKAVRVSAPNIIEAIKYTEVHYSDKVIKSISQKEG